MLTIVQGQELTNSFPTPVTLYSAHVDDARFSVLNFVPGTTLAPNASYVGLSLQYKGPPVTKIHRAYLTMLSNVAKEFSVPIWMFHGRLHVTTTSARAWARLGAQLHQKIEQHNMITKEVAVSEGSRLPKYSSLAPSLVELTELFSVFGGESALGKDSSGLHKDHSKDVADAGAGDDAVCFAFLCLEAVT